MPASVRLSKFTQTMLHPRLRSPVAMHLSARGARKHCMQQQQRLTCSMLEHCWPLLKVSDFLLHNSNVVSGINETSTARETGNVRILYYKQRGVCSLGLTKSPNPLRCCCSYAVCCETYEEKAVDLTEFPQFNTVAWFLCRWYVIITV